MVEGFFLLLVFHGGDGGVGDWRWFFDLGLFVFGGVGTVVIKRNFLFLLMLLVLWRLLAADSLRGEVVEEVKFILEVISCSS